MLLESTGEFLDAGLQKSGNEFWESADDSTASDEIRFRKIKFPRIKKNFHLSSTLFSLFFCFSFLFFVRRSVIETSRSLKELFHEARERASKALGFAKMLRKVRNYSNNIIYLNLVFLLIYSLFILPTIDPLT